MNRMTLANETITFTAEGVWIQPVLSDRFRWTGSVSELISIMVYHKELDIDTPRFYVRDTITVRPRSEVRRETIDKYGTAEDI